MLEEQPERLNWVLPQRELGTSKGSLSYFGLRENESLKLWGEAPKNYMTNPSSK